jgi:hypothetical protein
MVLKFKLICLLFTVVAFLISTGLAVVVVKR